MPLAKSKTQVGLGNALMKDRFGGGRGQDQRRTPTGVTRTAPDGSTYITTPKNEASWVKMRSVTEQPALDDFLATAELAGTDFTAEKINNVKILHRDQKNPYLLSDAEERATVRKHQANKKRLRIPRRPAWDETTTKEELDQRERLSLLDWRRGLAQLQDNDDLLMTPFERNIEVWRQLWRVIERSDLVVQIVDARNPLLFRCEDLESYVKDVDKRKRNLLLVNKADMMTLEQRQLWAAYFKRTGVRFRFFSAHLARDMNMLDSEDEGEPEEADLAKMTQKMRLQRAARENEQAGAAPESEEDEDEEEDSEEEDETEDDSEEESEEDEEAGTVVQAEDTRIITTDELEALFLRHAPQVEAGEDENQPRKVTIGLVGYPNVGKSSTINALIGAKKVSVSSTPGKTKHFQTIHLSERVILCDCPGLVFPNFATTKAELVCNGVLPIDQLREYSGPAALIAQRLPQGFVEAIYGLKIETRPIEEGGTGMPTGEELLRAYAIARGFQTTGLGQPDESRAARYIFKDYVNGKLLFCHPPPNDPPIDPKRFNQDLYDASHLPEKRRGHMAEASEQGPSTADLDMIPLVEGSKTRKLDSRFFAAGTGHAGHLLKPKHHLPPGVHSTSSGKNLTGRKFKTMVALERDVDPSELRLNSKKHNKANKRKKMKDRKGYE